MIVDDINGVVVKPGDAFQLAEVILRLLRHHDFTTCLDGVARRTVEHGHIVEQVADQYLIVCRELFCAPGY